MHFALHRIGRGVVITNSNLPPGKTSNLNFMAKGGGGIYIRTRKRESLDIGFRWSHISNANLGLDNPEFNGYNSASATIGSNRQFSVECLRSERTEMLPQAPRIGEIEVNGRP